MTASLLNGKVVALQLQRTLAEKTAEIKKNGQRPPGLAVILANQDPASAAYVARKRKACKYVGFESFNYDLPDTVTHQELLNLIQTLNKDPKVDGILVQLPLPPHIPTQHIIEAIDPAKDVDGFHPYNLGRLAQKHPLLRPCTPYGIMQLLAHYELPVQGKHAVVVGASNIVGRPMALELMMAGATVTVCHKQTVHLQQYIKMADLIVVATGARHCVDPDWLQAHQIVIDVGIHHLPGNHLSGDIDFEKAQSRVAWITPVPGGVGPMTVATLLQNTWIAYQSRFC